MESRPLTPGHTSYLKPALLLNARSPLSDNELLLFKTSLHTLFVPHSGLDIQAEKKCKDFHLKMRKLELSAGEESAQVPGQTAGPLITDPEVILMTARCPLLLLFRPRA